MHAPEYVSTMRLLLPLLRRQETFSVTPFEKLCDYFAYSWNRGTFAYVIEAGVPRGVCVIKLFSKPEQFLDEFVHQPEGMFMMVVAMIADSAETMGKLHDELLERWGPRQIILWERGSRTEYGSPRIYTWAMFEKLAKRITKNGLIPA